jgi:hypothetical protein
MKVLKSAAFLTLFLSIRFVSISQQDSALISRRALQYADSLTTAFKDHNWNRYLAISYPGIVTYYGGTKSYKAYVERARAINNSSAINEKTRLELIQLADNHSGEWQCVIRKTAPAVIDGQKAQVISYLIGQSTDNGAGWKFLDVSSNSAENIAYMMPDKFTALTIPQRRIIFEKDQLAKLQ